MSENLKSVVSSPHDAQSIVRIVGAIFNLKEELRKLEIRVEALENKKAQSRLVAPSSRDGTAKGK